MVSPPDRSALPRPWSNRLSRLAAAPDGSPSPRSFSSSHKPFSPPPPPTLQLQFLTPDLAATPDPSTPNPPPDPPLRHRSGACIGFLRSAEVADRPQWAAGADLHGGGGCTGRWSPHGVEGGADSVRGGVQQSGRPWSTKVPAQAGRDPSVIGSGRDLMARSLTWRAIAVKAPDGFFPLQLHPTLVQRRSNPRLPRLFRTRPPSVPDDFVLKCHIIKSHNKIQNNKSQLRQEIR